MIAIDFCAVLLYNFNMNNTILKFLSEKHIDLNKIAQLDDNHIKSGWDINPLLFGNEIFKNDYISKIISIADIVGYDYNFYQLGQNLINNMSSFFDENANSYERRSISMLDYSTDEIIEKLSDSFEIEPMSLNEVDSGKYVIGDNGLHRFHVIKAHYLKELSLINQNDKEAVAKLKNKYMLDVRVSELDIFKSYSSYILKKLAQLQNQNIRIRTHYDSHWNITGNVVIEQPGQSPQILNDKELLAFMKKYIVDFILNKSISRKTYKAFIKEIKNNCNNYDSFKEFYSQNLQNIFENINDLNNSSEFEEEFE